MRVAHGLLIGLLLVLCDESLTFKLQPSHGPLACITAAVASASASVSSTSAASAEPFATVPAGMISIPFGIQWTYFTVLRPQLPSSSS